jgi:anti-sigma B factor antagonist/stage II sporulation protein AA (anti-sigma F factor antagonist)
MDLAPRRLADTVVLRPAGRIDHGSAEAFKRALEPFLERCAAAGDRLVLDCSGLEYISSAGLRVLILAHRQARAEGGTLVVAELRPMVKEIFEIGRFTAVFEVFGSVREALGRVSPLALAALEAR